MKQLHYTLSGKGNTVVFLHGFMENSTMWETTIAHFPNQLSLSVDLHGHGNSFFDETLTPSCRLMAGQVSALIDELKIEQATVIGHSLGGYVAAELLEFDTRVNKIVLLHSHPWPDAPAKKEDRNRVIELVKTKASFFIREAIPHLFAHPQRHKETIEKYCLIAEKMNPSAIAWSAAAMRDRLGYVEVLRQHCAKVSIIQGELDPIIPNIALRQWSNDNALRFEEIKNCGHMSHEEAPNDLIQLLKEFLV